MASNRNTNGVISMPASLKTKKASADSPTAKTSTRPGVPRLRLIIRRLPPGLTQVEFQSILTGEWQVGAGKVDWFAYKDGKVSKDPSKPSRPARAYLKVKDQTLLDTLSAIVKQSHFHDAKNTSKDHCLLGPPSLEFAPYGKSVSGRVRKDGRQGTIDQDPEFITFLQSLTEPAPKPNTTSEVGEDASTKPQKLTTTPLVEFLKERKANKGRENIASKASKSQLKNETKDAKSDRADSRKISVVKKEAQRSSEKAKPERPPQDSAKSTNKTMAVLQNKPDKQDSGAPTKPPASTIPPTKRERERDRGTGSIAARILQRDLGLTPRAERRALRGNVPISKASGTAGPEAKATTMPATPELNDKISESSTTTLPGKSKASPTKLPGSPNAAPTSPYTGRAALSNTTPTNRPTSASSGRPSRLPPTPSPGAKSAFLKHANGSQGITEELLQSTFSVFGEVTRCEIDRKKGFGHVDFQETEGLKKAMAASPVKVGEKGGQVVVLENKIVKIKRQSTLQLAKAAETKAAMQQSPATPPLSPKPESAEVMPKASASSSPVVPVAPRAAHLPFRGGSPHRGSRRDNQGHPRGGFVRGGRGGGRANFRGRAAHEGSRRGAAAAGKNSGSPAPVSAVPVTQSTPTTEAKNSESGG